jgi:hypothetical protein
MTIRSHHRLEETMGKCFWDLRFRFSVRGLMALVALSAIALTLGACTVDGQCSCHLCHNRKEVFSRTVLGAPIWQTERMTTNFPVSIDHRHEWYHYGTVTRGFLGAQSRDCRINVYADGSSAPDGMR